MVLQDFYDGKSFDAYEFFGGHKVDGSFRFRTYAPNAKKVTVIGEFNGWEESEMIQEGQSGVFSISGAKAEFGMMYKYCIYTKEGYRVEHCDPYGFRMELRPAASSILTDLNSYKFNDKNWMNERDVNYDKPLNIYELHLGSWRKKSEEEDGWYSYKEIAEPLISYVKENAFTHIEVMPLSEHPFDGSWGYQNTGFFAPTSRYGTPDELKYLIDKCHQAGIGVIMDFVPVHFAVDYYGLKEYDGTELYEYPSSDVTRSEWGSCNFIHSRREVRCFLQSSANYWLKEFHFDGLRMDAVSRLIYWQGNESRGENGLAIEFIKVMNGGLKRMHPTAMLIAEDSTTYVGVTKPIEDDGLGFDYKWDLGWMHDTLQYFQTAPEYRTRDYHKLTFSMSYFFNERYILEFSHDEVVHGKATILQKMNGEYDEKFPQARAMYLYMMMHPGKKLNFMGNEIGHFREWDEKKEQDWDLLKYPMHDAFHKYYIKLNNIYMKNDSLHYDYDKGNFKWVDCHQEEKCIYSLSRQGKKDTLLAIFNFSNKDCVNYDIPIKKGQKIKLILHSNFEEFGGDVSANDNIYTVKKKADKMFLSVNVKGYSGILFKVSI